MIKMGNSDEFELFLVTDMSRSPEPLPSAKGDRRTYTRTIKHPIPPQIIVFSIGDWSLYTPSAYLDVQLISPVGSYKLGTLTHVHRCVYWEKHKCMRRSELDMLPKSETSLSLVISLVGDCAIKSDRSRPVACNEKNPPNQNVGLPSEIYCDQDIGSTWGEMNKKRKSSSGTNSPTVKKKKTRIMDFINDKENIRELILEKSAVLPNTENAVLPRGTNNTRKPAKRMPASCKEVTCKDHAMPSCRWGHTMTFLTDHMAILIGGQGEKRQLCKDALWLFNTETRKWHTMRATMDGQQRPDMRLGHTATYDPLMRCVYVYGGSKNTKWVHDVHMLDLDNSSWQLIKTGDKAPILAYHSATLYRHEVWVFGGIYPQTDPLPDLCSNDLHIFSPVTQSWRHPVVMGTKPLPRSGHSATMFSDQLVVFGGWDFPVCFSELFILDVGSTEWSQPMVTGSSPKPRSWHGAAALSHGRLLIHGGYDGDVAIDDTHIFTLDTLTWTTIRVDNPETPRAGHSIFSLPYSRNKGRNDEVIVFGGGDNDDSYFKDVFSLSVPFRPVLASKYSEWKSAFNELTKTDVNR